MGIVVFTLIALSALLRLWQGEELFFWNVDQDLISLTVKRIVEDFRPQLVGFPIPGGIYLGPIFYYLASVVFIFTGMNPSWIYIFSGLSGALASFLVYRVGEEIFKDERVGFFAAVIFGLSYLANIYSRNLSGLILGPILALLVYLLLYRSILAKRAINLFFLTAVLLLAAQNEGSSLSLIILAIAVFVIYKIRIRTHQLFWVSAVFVIFHLPLLVFDLRHDFFLTKSIVNFTSRFSGQGHFDSNILFDVLSVFPNFMSRAVITSGSNDVSAQILPCADLLSARQAAISPVLFIFSTAVLGWFLITGIFKRRKILGESIIFIHLLIMIIGLFFYNLFLPGYVHEWILVIFLPAVSFIYALVLTNFYKSGIWGKLLVTVFLISFIVFNVSDILTSTNKYGLRNKVNAAKVSLDLVGERPFYLVSLGSCHAQGYIYLFDYLGKSPSYVEGLIFNPAYFQQGPKPKLGVVLASPSENENSKYFEKYDYYSSLATSAVKVDDIEVLIIEDE